jgi:hypothetical protein
MVQEWPLLFELEAATTASGGQSALSITCCPPG